MTQLNVDNRGGVATTFYIQNCFETDRGLLQLPSATEDGQCEFVRTKAPVTRRVVNWVAERMGSMPMLPDPETHDSNEELLRTSICPANVTPNSDGVPVFYVSGQYVYGLRSATYKSGNKISGSPAYNSYGVAEIEESAFHRYL